MEKWAKVLDIMTREVITVGPLEPMTRVKELFEKEPIHHLPVVEDGKVVGMLSKTDYLRLLHGFTLFKTQKSDSYNEAVMRSLLVKEVMTKPVVTVKPEDTVGYAADIFKENLFHAVPVVDAAGQLVGILSTFDLLVHAYGQPVNK